MLSLCELQRAVRILRKNIPGGRLRRIIQPDALKLVLVIEAASEKWQVVLSCSSESARISVAEQAEAGASSGSFHEYLRAHLAGSVVETMECASDNRQVRMTFRSPSESIVLMLSLLGSRSNLYLLNGEGTLVHALRPLDETRNELKIGEAWEDPRGSVPSAGTDRWQEWPDEQYLNALEQTYLRLELRSLADQKARRIQQAIKKEKAFLDRKLINLQEDLGEAKQAEECRHKGELLKNVLHTIRHGDDKAIATDFATGETVEIPLDPKIPPAANLEAYFARYQKQTRGTQLIQQQLEELGEARSELDVLDQHLASALSGASPDLHALETIESAPTVRRLIHRYFPEKKSPPRPAQAAAKKDVPSKLLPKRYKTQEGLEIWVGRNDEGNDYLTTRLARGNDLFFHLEGYPGSHVVLRTEGRTDPPPKSILDACELAVHYSKMKNADRADVHMAPIKNVKKPKGAKSGLVYVRSGKTIHLKRDPKRLQNILASRLDS
jgi:predicted ribosome quality control (RQC) complex YloA/Tae2 family protein